MKAGTHAIAAAFEKDTVLPEGIIFKERFDAITSHFEGVGNISVAGPYNVQGPGKPRRSKSVNGRIRTAPPRPQTHIPRRARSG
jgi:hypothetical protein